MPIASSHRSSHRGGPDDTALARRFSEQLHGYLADARTFLEPETQPLIDELDALIASGGKRLRPCLCYWGHRAAGGPDSPAIIRAAAALELLHTMALIQDDVMDGSATRRNRASTFQRLGASAAILTGMLGFTLADRMFRTAGFSGSAAARAADAYDAMRARAIAGQYLDVRASKSGSTDEATALRVASLKSGSYSVADPLTIGALLADGDAAAVSALKSAGKPLGEAFQMRDDVLGMFGDPRVTGKDREGDIRENKQTVLLAKTRAAATAEQAALLDRVVGRPDLLPEDADRVREIVIATGALQATNDMIRSLTDQALTALGSGHLDPVATEELRRLAEQIATRAA